jgi:hypothetical protein
MTTYAGKLGFIPTPLVGPVSRAAITPHDYAGKLDVIPTPLSTGVWSRTAVTSHDYLGYAMRWGDSTVPFPGDTGIIIGPATNLPEGVFLSADLLGSGTLSTEFIMWREINSALPGTGTLDTELFRDLAFSATLPGLGTLEVDLQQIANITADFLGTGTLSVDLLSKQWRPFAMERTDVEFTDVNITDPSDIYSLDHDLFANAVGLANQHSDIDFHIDSSPDIHVAHSSVILTAGNGLVGGGDITASRSFDFDVTYSPTFVGLTLTGLTPDSGVYTNGSSALTNNIPTSGTLGFWTRTGSILDPASADDVRLADDKKLYLGTGNDGYGEYNSAGDKLYFWMNRGTIGGGESGGMEFEVEGWSTSPLEGAHDAAPIRFTTGNGGYSTSGSYGGGQGGSMHFVCGRGGLATSSGQVPGFGGDMFFTTGIIGSGPNAGASRYGDLTQCVVGGFVRIGNPLTDGKLAVQGGSGATPVAQPEAGIWCRGGDAASSSGNKGGDNTFIGGDGGADFVSGAGDGGDLWFTGGAGGTPFAGGAGHGGKITFSGGVGGDANPTAMGRGGDLEFYGGNAGAVGTPISGARGGDISFFGGTGSSSGGQGDGGDINFTAGTPSIGTSLPGKINFGTYTTSVFMQIKDALTGTELDINPSLGVDNRLVVNGWMQQEMFATFASFSGNYVGIRCGIAHNITTLTAVSNNVTQAHYLMLLDASSNAVTATLPPTPNTGETHIFKCTNDDNTVTISGNGNNIDGAASITLILHESINVIADSNDDWWIY